MKVLLVGHACSPVRGSESAVTWNLAWHLSLTHEVWVLTDPQFKDDIERHMEAHPNPKLNFVWVTLPRRWDPRRSVQSERGLRLHYILWQRAVLREARRLHRTHRFDVAHHVSWGTISAPPLLWRLPIPFVWGPIGGGQTAPPAFRRYFGQSWSSELLRTFRVKVVTRLPALRNAVRGSALILSTNTETTRALASAGATQVRPFPNIGVPEALMSLPVDERERPHEGMTLLWVGRLIPLKALPLALEALAQVEREMDVRLQVVGDGPQRAEMERLAHALGVGDRVEFVGVISFQEMPEYYRRADAFLFTSLRDTSGTVLYEAMASRLPLLTLDHQGASVIVPPEAGIKVPVTTPQETVEALAEGIRRLAQSPATRRSMGEAGWTHAQDMGWSRRAQQMILWYEEVIRKGSDRKPVSYAAL